MQGVSKEVGTEKKYGGEESSINNGGTNHPKKRNDSSAERIGSVKDAGDFRSRADATAGSSSSSEAEHWVRRKEYHLQTSSTAPHHHWYRIEGFARVFTGSLHAL